MTFRTEVPDHALLPRAGPGGVVATALAIAEAHAPIADSHDAREGVSAFFERRTPHWQGR